MVRRDVIALGELLIDFINVGESEYGNPVFEANPGGAPCNVLAMLSKLGRDTSFIGKVGADQFGKQLRATLKQVGISDEYLLDDEKVPTTLAFVHKLPDGDRSFSFYRNPGADVMLCENDIKVKMLEGGRVFHFGTLSLTHEESRKATIKALEAAKAGGMIISLDPNLRESLWDNLDTAREMMLKAISYCDVLKISDNEVLFVSGLEDYDEAVAWLRERFDIKLICLTLGSDGSRAYYKDLRVEAPGVRVDTVVDATGAGDTFCGCMLDFICKEGLEDLDEEKLKDMLAFANAAASIVVTRKGAIRSMPDRTEIEKILK